MYRYSLIAAVLLLSACSTGYKELKTLAPVEAKLKLATQWVADTGAKHQREYRQLPVVSHDDTLYMANTQNVAAMDLNTGAIKWQRTLPGERIIAGPGVGNNTLVVVQNAATLSALQSSDGKTLWRVKTDTEVLSTPLVVQDKVLVQSVDGRLSAYRLSSGKLIWSERQPMPPMSLRGGSSPILFDDTIIAGFANGKIAAYKLDNGKLLWESALAVPRGRTDLERMVDVDAQLLLRENIIYAVSYNGRIAAMSAVNGRIIWSREMSSYSGLSLNGDQIYLSDAKGFIWALDINSGATVWRQEQLLDREPSVPVVLNNTVVVGDVEGNVHWLSRQDGAFLARLNLKDVYFDAHMDWGDDDRLQWSFAVNTVLVDKQRLLVRDDSGSLSMFQLPADDSKSGSSSSP